MNKEVMILSRRFYYNPIFFKIPFINFGPGSFFLKKLNFSNKRKLNMKRIPFKGVR